MITLSEAQIGRLLVGRRVSISVGEPWDFTSDDGDNVLRGEITEVGYGQERGSKDSGKPGKQEVLLTVTPFTARSGHRVDHLTARARYSEEAGIVERLARGEEAQVNLSYSDQVPEEERDPRGTPKLIGAFELAEK